MSLFAEVLLPLALPGNYTYRVPEHLAGKIGPGKRVAVQFGKSRIYSALVFRLNDSFPARYAPKELLDVLDDTPVVTQQQFRLWEWISAYYLCTLGEVMAAALPASLKLSSQTTIMLNGDTRDAARPVALSEKELLVCSALEQQHELTVNDVGRLLGRKTVMPLIKSLLEKEIILVSEQMGRGYRPKTEAFLRLDPAYGDRERLEELFTILERAPRQLDALMTYLRLARNRSLVPRRELMAESGVSGAVIGSLVEKEIFRVEEKEVSRIRQEEVHPLTELRFSPAQQQACDAIGQELESREAVLLHGVTSSGKTLLYVKLIEECLQQGKQVLYLLPEIAITEQMTERLRSHFGEHLAVYHSRFNDNERAEIWKNVLDGRAKVVLGARSALFLPFGNLGLVIVDEEHESSFKQFDPAPRYHARDTAVYLAGLHKAKTLLGSATPSLESYYNAVEGKYGLVKLTERYGETLLPEIEVVDMLRETRKKTVHSHFSSALLEAIRSELAQKKQVILFRNRRGYVPVIICRACGYVPQCIHCDISLTYHRSNERLVCHYCGYAEKPLPSCPACGSAHMEQKGFGTEKVEDELKILLPGVRVARLDLDNTRAKYAFQQLLNDFEDGRIDILVGTQMVTKGLDFGNVSLVGILDADSLFRYPDFRAFERSYQLMVQVSGRSGRRQERGRVMIQTTSPGHPIIGMVRTGDYERFYRAEIAERRQFGYPPFFRLINVRLKHKDPDYLAEGSNFLGTLLRSRLGKRVLGPQVPPVGRIRNQYIRDLMIKIDRKKDSVSKVKDILEEAVLEVRRQHGSLLVQADVDPM